MPVFPVSRSFFIVESASFLPATVRFTERPQAPFVQRALFSQSLTVAPQRGHLMFSASAAFVSLSPIGAARSWRVICIVNVRMRERNSVSGIAPSSTRARAASHFPVRSTSDTGIVLTIS